MSLSICYITARRDNRIEWFFDSLAKQVVLQGHIIVVDHFADEVGRKEEIFEKFAEAFRVPLDIELKEKGNAPSKFFTHVSPKPTVWQGPCRLTREDWFAMASARNTALCICRTNHICYVDDLSVLMPGWWQAVQEAVAGNYIGCGAYKKVKELNVENGVPVHYIETESGMDNRLGLVSKDVSECNGEWLYGCSLVAPVEALLSVDGWPESLCDGMGFEDCLMGIVLGNAGWHLKFDRRILTLESDELHFVEPAMKRSDFGTSPADKSHRALEIARASKAFDNGFGEGGIRALRDRILDGTPFSIQNNPQHEWFTGKRLSEL